MSTRTSHVDQSAVTPTTPLPFPTPLADAHSQKERPPKGPEGRHIEETSANLAALVQAAKKHGGSDPATGEFKHLPPLVAQSSPGSVVIERLTRQKESLLREREELCGVIERERTERERVEQQNLELHHALSTAQDGALQAHLVSQKTQTRFLIFVILAAAALVIGFAGLFVVSGINTRLLARSNPPATPTIKPEIPPEASISCAPEPAFHTVPNATVFLAVKIAEGDTPLKMVERFGCTRFKGMKSKQIAALMKENGRFLRGEFEAGATLYVSSEDCDAVIGGIRSTTP